MQVDDTCFDSCAEFRYNKSLLALDMYREFANNSKSKGQVLGMLSRQAASVNSYENVCDECKAKFVDKLAEWTYIINTVSSTRDQSGGR